MKFHCKTKFEKLVHLVGFIIRIYHDARSHKRQKSVCVCVFSIAVSFSKSLGNPFVLVTLRLRITVERACNLLSIYYRYRDNVSRVDKFRTEKFRNKKQFFAFYLLLLFPFRPITYTSSVSVGSDIYHVVPSVST